MNVGQKHESGLPYLDLEFLFVSPAFLKWTEFLDPRNHSKNSMKCRSNSHLTEVAQSTNLKGIA